MAHKILQDFKGSPNGYVTVDYFKDSVVELSPSLAEVAIAEGWAEEVAEPTEEPAFTAKHRGAGKWDVFGPDGLVASDLDKKSALAEAERLNAVAKADEVTE